MHHDLGLYGDIAEACMECLRDQYHVDLNQFEFEKFFPPEFEGKGPFTRAIISIVPFVGPMMRRGAEYKPLTLGMIGEAIRRKRFHFE